MSFSVAIGTMCSGWIGRSIGQRRELVLISKDLELQLQGLFEQIPG